MANKKLVAVVAALMLSLGSGASQAAYTEGQLIEIERLVQGERWSDLQDYIDANPDLLVGENPLSGELRRFTSSVRISNIIAEVSASIPLSRFEAVKDLSQAQQSY